MTVTMFNSKQKSDIVNLYVSDRLSSYRIAEMYKCSCPTILSVLKENNVEKIKFSHRKYRVNDHAFDDERDQDAWYWIGFIYADGCVSVSDSETHNLLSVQIDASDVDHLYKLKSFMCADNPVHVYTRKQDSIRGHIPKNKMRTYCDIRFFSHTIASRLIDVGVTKGRNSVCRARESIPDDMFRHWLRGYIDGDGYISKGKNCRITITGQDDLLEWIKDSVSFHTGLRNDYPIRHGSLTNEVGDIMYNGRFVCKKICRWIYEDANTFLDRKRNAYIGWK